MALTDQDIEEIYAIINEALEAVETKEKARGAAKVADKNALELEYKSKRQQIKEKAKGRTTGAGR